MFNLFRVVFALLICCAGSAHALIPKEVVYSATPGHCAPAPTFTGTSVASVCAQILGWYQGSCDAINSGASGVESQQDPPLCHITQNNGGPGVNFSLSVSGGACPAGSVSSGSGCECDSSHTEINGACQPKNTDKEACDAWSAVAGLSGGALVQDYRLQGNIAHGAEFCMSGANTSAGKGCKVQFDKSAAFNYGSDAAPQWVSEGTFDTHNTDTTDQSCTLGEGENPKPVPKPEKCKDGYTGTVNGVETCIKKVPDSGVGNNDKEETTDTEEETKKVKTESKTECKNGTCTTTNTVTTTVTKKPGGETTTSTSTTTTTQGQGPFCKENPGVKMCSNGDDAGVGDVGGVTGGKEHGQPDLYETKYPNGIKGVWESSGIAGADGKFGQLAGALLPGIADANGACLSFQIPLNMGIVDFGLLDISPPCIIWPFIRICILITALWLARSLIFGG